MRIQKIGLDENVFDELNLWAVRPLVNFAYKLREEIEEHYNSNNSDESAELVFLGYQIKDRLEDLHDALERLNEEKRDEAKAIPISKARRKDPLDLFECEEEDPDFVIGVLQLLEEAFLRGEVDNLSYESVSYVIMEATEKMAKIKTSIDKVVETLRKGK